MNWKSRPIIPRDRRILPIFFGLFLRWKRRNRPGRNWESDRISTRLNRRILTNWPLFCLWFWRCFSFLLPLLVWPFVWNEVRFFPFVYHFFFQFGQFQTINIESLKIEVESLSGKYLQSQDPSQYLNCSQEKMEDRIYAQVGTSSTLQPNQIFYNAQFDSMGKVPRKKRKRQQNLQKIINFLCRKSWRYLSLCHICSSWCGLRGRKQSPISGKLPRSSWCSNKKTTRW